LASAPKHLLDEILPDITTEGIILAFAA